MKDNKKALQLGMNPGTASHRLVKDILWHFIISADRDTCYKCGKSMARDTFSIEHIIPWLDSEDPTGLFFDINNISFSHLICNVRDCRKPLKKYETKEQATEAKRSWDKKRGYSSERRRAQYERTKK